MLVNKKLDEYLEQYKVEWADSLPENCPPNDILVPNGDVFYRFLTYKDKIVDEDWLNYAKLNPQKIYNPKDLVNANGLSILTDYTKMAKLPAFKRKGVAKLTLNATDGVVKKTYNQKEHYTWWRTKSFDPNKAEILNTDEEA